MTRCGVLACGAVAPLSFKVCTRCSSSRFSGQSFLDHADGGVAV